MFIFFSQAGRLGDGFCHCNWDGNTVVFEHASDHSTVDRFVARRVCDYICMGFLYHFAVFVSFFDKSIHFLLDRLRDIVD